MNTHAEITYHDFACGTQYDGGLPPFQFSKSILAWSLEQRYLDRQNLIPVTSTAETSYTIALPRAGRYGKNSSAMTIQGKHNSIERITARATLGAKHSHCLINDGIRSIEQTIALEHFPNLRYRCNLNESVHYWRTLGPSQTVIELVSAQGRRIALFVYTNNVAQQIDPAGRRLMPVKKHEAGQLHIMGSLDRESMPIELVICSAVVVVAMRKMRPARHDP